MAATDKKEARIVVTRGVRTDLRVEIGVFVPSEGGYHEMGLCPVREEHLAAHIAMMKQQLERAGHWATVVERSGS